MWIKLTTPKTKVLIRFNLTGNNDADHAPLPILFLCCLINSLLATSGSRSFGNKLAKFSLFTFKQTFGFFLNWGCHRFVHSEHSINNIEERRCSPVFPIFVTYDLSKCVLVHKRLSLDGCIDCKRTTLLYFAKVYVFVFFLVSLKPLMSRAAYLVTDCYLYLMYDNANKT